MVGVAQFGRALRCGRSGWEFKSPRSPCQLKKPLFNFFNLGQIMLELVV